MPLIRQIAPIAWVLSLPLVAGCGHAVAVDTSTAVEQAKDGSQQLEELGLEAKTGSGEVEGREQDLEGTAAPPKPAVDDSNPLPKKGKSPTADRRPRRPGEPEKITFEDLIIGLQADVVYRPFMLSERAKELDGERVSIRGYMHGALSGTGKATEFVLLRNTECKYGPGGQADHLAQVYLKEGDTTTYSPDTITVEGKLKIEPFTGPDGNTWSIYRLEEASVAR